VFLNLFSSLETCSVTGSC